jgi:RNA-directed DNA polymerase
MTRIGLTLNEAKTSIKQARRERFDFLGYTFGPHRLRKDGHVYLGASPSQKSVSRLRQKVADLLVRQNVAPWTDVRDRLNRVLRGWSNYFGYGTRLMAYRAVDHYVHERVDRAAGTIDHTPEAVDVWAAELRLRFGGPPVAVALEQSRGPRSLPAAHLG